MKSCINSVKSKFRKPSDDSLTLHNMAIAIVKMTVTQPFLESITTIIEILTGSVTDTFQSVIVLILTIDDIQNYQRQIIRSSL